MSDNPIKDIIETDIENARRKFNDPEPPKPFAYGDGSGERRLLFEVAGDRCPLCGDEHDRSFTFNGVVMIACPEMPTGMQLPLRRVEHPGPYTLIPPPPPQKVKE